jgi:GWxTD domain-containing protein
VPRPSSALKLAIPLALLAMASSTHGFTQSSHQNVEARIPSCVTVYCNWTEDDVPWIITPEERTSFHLLKNDEERSQFIAQFWYRRDPTPDTVENESEDEYYRRVLYANENFATPSKPGWRTDRGRTLILVGPPDQITSGAQILPKGAAAKAQVWNYRYLEGIGTNVSLSFADRTGDDGYTLELPDGLDASSFLQDAIPKVPPDPEIVEYMRTHPGQPVFIEVLLKPPTIRFKDLEEVVNHKISYHMFPIKVDTSVTPATKNINVLKVTTTIPRTKLEACSVGLDAIQIFGRIVDMRGRVFSTNEVLIKPLDSSEQDSPSRTLQATFDLPLFPGRYRLYIAVHDVGTDTKSTASLAVSIRETSD